MILAQQEQSLAVTEHALLIAYARFGEQIGLVNAIEHVPFKMKMILHSPADKVIELLHSISPETVEELKGALRQVIEPYRRRMLRALSPFSLVVDFDLTGLVVSDQATTYEGSDFGHLGKGTGAVGRGYQFARAQVVGDKDTLVLGAFLPSA